MQSVNKLQLTISKFGYLNKKNKRQKIKKQCSWILCLIMAFDYCWWWISYRLAEIRNTKRWSNYKQFFCLTQYYFTPIPLQNKKRKAIINYFIGNYDRSKLSKYRRKIISLPEHINSWSVDADQQYTVGNSTKILIF